MINYENFIHPFQNDPGCSQSQRVLDNLLGGSTKIDGRTLADLLNYFKQLSHNVKYSFVEKDATTAAYILKEDSWSEFFSDSSIPFVLAAAANTNAAAVNDKLKLYHYFVTKKPSPQALQLLIYFYYYSAVNKINKLYRILKNSNLPVATLLEQQIKNKLQAPVASFIKAVYTAHNLAGIKCIDFTDIFIEQVWNIKLTDVDQGEVSINEINSGLRHQLLALQSKIQDSFSAVLQSLDIISGAAVEGIHQSLILLPEELKQKQSPHLALLLTFLSMFTKLQDDLNGYTKKHLDFFYKDVLQLKPAEAKPDQVHIIFELQKQLKQYALKKGLLVKAGKDKNNVEMNFGIDSDIVLNKTQIADLRTLYMNNQQVYNDVYVEGAYMATKANTSDGIDKDFTAEPKNYSTLGAKYSKYIAPGSKSPQRYPTARIGFVLASPVLLLNEGERTITITLTCHLNNNCSGISQSLLTKIDPCCNPVTAETASVMYPSFIDTALLFSAVQRDLSNVFIYINSQQLETAKKQGLSVEKADKIYYEYLKNKEVKNIFCDHIENLRDKDDAVTRRVDWDRFLATNAFSLEETNLLSDIFKPVRPLKVLFSGEKNWIDPTVDSRSNFADPVIQDPISVSIEGAALSFKIKIQAVIGADKPPVTFYNKDVLKEDLGSTQPLAKVELDASIKLVMDNQFLRTSDDVCSLEKRATKDDRYISLYHFFRNVIVDETDIKVKVCGLKNFIVQNDESVQDVNSPVYPFGTRPTIIDFDAVNSNLNDQGSKPEITKTEKNKDTEAIETLPKERNLVGPNFYIGSAEIFSKKWDQVCVNLNWKDKPKDFKEYYKAYLKRYNVPRCNVSVPGPPIPEVVGLNECGFEVNVALLDNGEWKKENKESTKAFLNPETTHNNRLLFQEGHCKDPCRNNESFGYSFFIEPADFGVAVGFKDPLVGLKKYEVSSRKGFLKFTLENQDFLHKDYAFVLARQMMALGKFPDVILENAIYGSGDSVIVYKNLGPALALFQKLVGDTKTDAEAMYQVAKQLLNDYNAAIEPMDKSPEVPDDDKKKKGKKSKTGSIDDDERDMLTPQIIQNEELANDTKEDALQTDAQLMALRELFKLVDSNNNTINIKEVSVFIPNEPWTPIISNMALDYTASADKKDISLIHLYPYKNTYRKEELTMAPALFPTFCDEGSLYIGLSDVVPDTNVNLLFQLAEATSDTESGPQQVSWQYLTNNSWLSLRHGFEVLDDDTKNLTASGIVQFALPGNISVGNSIMPPEHYWIKACVAQNSRAVCETINIYTQALKAGFVVAEGNDTSRLSEALVEKSISKLQTADANVKQVIQPFASFDGREPEGNGHFYTRVSELLRHKGRAIQKFDYERLVLEAFPSVYKTKCINHSFFLDANKFDNDFPVAPGYVLLAVIPDLTRLQSGQSFEPKLPQRVIEEIQQYLAPRISPFVKLKAVNPRYEKINIRLSVILKKGYDATFYKDKLEKDIREFLAPWAVGIFDKLRFGECVNKSDLVYFLETRDYMDYITTMQLQSEFDKSPPSDEVTEICPLTPRSVLLAGEIQICIEDNNLEEWTATACNQLIPVMNFEKKPPVIPV
jgi:hypothetical protein